MKRRIQKGAIVITSIFVCCSVVVYAQVNYSIKDKDTVVNNLKHTSGYITSAFNDIPQYRKWGTGKRTLILIPGMGFDASVFNDFIEAHKNEYVLYAITIPGYGNTSAPPMPDSTVSYGEQTWSKSAAKGILKLIQQEQIVHPIIVGHFVLGAQLALRIAIEHPDHVGGVIILGGSAKMLGMVDNKIVNPSLKEMINGVDNFYAPKWFKAMKKEFYDKGNFTNDVYSLQEDTGNVLWKHVATVPMPVAVRYSCEYFASDITADADKIQCRVLVLRPSFTETFWDNPMKKNWIWPQFIESWNIVAKTNPKITIEDISRSGAFVWKDNPDETYKKIKEFLLTTK